MVGPGRFAGGITIAKSLTLRGAAAAATVISGGGPVLTIGGAGAAGEPTVSIAGITIRDGVNGSGANEAFGGGIPIPRAPGGGTGATVTVTDSLITSNRTAPPSRRRSAHRAPVVRAGTPAGTAAGSGTPVLSPC